MKRLVVAQGGEQGEFQRTGEGRSEDRRYVLTTPVRGLEAAA
jgi:hypothetical protein